MSYNTRTSARLRRGLSRKLSQSAPAPILRLPNELLTEIVSLCSDSRADVAALAQTCNRLLDISAPHLYRSVVISCGGLHSKDEDVRRVVSICSALLSEFCYCYLVQSLRLDDFRSVCPPLDLNHCDISHLTDTTSCPLATSFLTFISTISEHLWGLSSEAF